MSKWYDAAADEVLSQLKTNQYTGLRQREAKKRLAKGGRNYIYPVPKGHFREYLLHMLTDFTSVLLLICAGLCLVFERNRSAIVIALTLLLSYGFCALIYMRAQKVLENMGSFALPVAKVMRDGRLYLARCEQIVKGDIVFLSAGDVVPADIRLLECDDLVVDEDLILPGTVCAKNAKFVATGETDLAGQTNMAFAATIVLSGSAKGVVVATGGSAAVCRLKKSRPIVSHDKLRLLERLRKICGVWSLVMLALVFFLTALSLFLGRGGLFDSMLSLLSLAVASMAELYIAFGYIVVASGVFSALRQYKDVNAGALIKNSSKLDEIKRLTCIAAPKDGCFVVDELSVEQVYADDILYGVGDRDFLGNCGTILEYAVISTGIYGSKNLVSINSVNDNVYSTEEEAIISCAQTYSLYNYNLDKEFPLLDHRRSGENNPFDTTLVSKSGENMVVVRGDAISVIYKCTHRRRQGKGAILSAHETNELLLAANRLAIGGYRVCAIATKGTSVMNLKGLSRAQQRLTFEGFIVFRETLLPDAAKNIQMCGQAGIKVIMFCDTVSEHNRYTARALGVMKNDEEIMTGKMLAEMDDGVFVASARQYSLYEGLTLSQKRKVIGLLKLAGENVAYLGCRVEEGPIVGDADVGYCQSVTLSARADKGGVDTLNRNIPILLKSSKEGGSRGCDALKIKSDVIVSLADHSGNGGFNAIVKSIRVAKGVYENLYHMLGYLVTSQIARLILVIFSIFSGVSLFSPVQIIVSGLIVDFAAVMVFAFDQTKKNALTDSGNYEKRLSGLLNGFGRSLAFAGLWAVLLTLTVMLAGRFGFDGKTIAFFGFLFTQLISVWEFRTEKSIFKSGKGFNNVLALFSVFLLSFIALISFMPEWPVLFDIQKLLPLGWAFCAAAPLLMTVGYEIEKWIASHLQNQKTKQTTDDVSESAEGAAEKPKKKKRGGKSEEEAIAERFADQEPPEVPAEEEPPALGALDASTLRELVFLSVKCGVTEMDIAGFGADSPEYDLLIEPVVDVIRPDSSVEVIATVLIASFSAQQIGGISFDACMQCAQKIKENMSL